MSAIDKLQWLLIAAAALLSAGCGPDKGAMMRARNEALRAQFSAGQCREIYDEADGYFQRNQSPESWIALCGKLRSEMGAWLSSDVQGEMRWFPDVDGTAWIEGTARFEKESCKFRTYWEVRSGSAKLFDIVLERPGGKVNVPGFAGRLVD